MKLTWIVWCSFSHRVPPSTSSVPACCFQTVFLIFFDWTKHFHSSLSAEVVIMTEFVWNYFRNKLICHGSYSMTRAFRNANVFGTMEQTIIYKFTAIDLDNPCPLCLIVCLLNGVKLKLRCWSLWMWQLREENHSGRENDGVIQKDTAQESEAFLHQSCCATIMQHQW